MQSSIFSPELSQLMRVSRATQGLSKAALARKTGLSGPMIGLMEGGTRGISQTNFFRLQKYFGWSSEVIEPFLDLYGIEKVPDKITLPYDPPRKFANYTVTEAHTIAKFLTDPGKRLFLKTVMELEAELRESETPLDYPMMLQIVKMITLQEMNLSSPTAVRLALQLILDDAQ